MQAGLAGYLQCTFDCRAWPATHAPSRADCSLVEPPAARRLPFFLPVNGTIPQSPFLPARPPPQTSPPIHHQPDAHEADPSLVCLLLYLAALTSDPVSTVRSQGPNKHSHSHRFALADAHPHSLSLYTLPLSKRGSALITKRKPPRLLPLSLLLLLPLPPPLLP